MEFEEKEFQIEILNDNSMVHNMAEFVDAAIKYLK